MATSPPTSPPVDRPRPLSAMMRPPRSSSRMSTSSKQAESRASDDDSRTSVKVAVRVRPPLKSSDPGFELIPQRFQRSMLQVTSPTSLAVDSPQGRKLFVFDKVFGEEVLQDGVWEYISESVNSFIQGYNVSVMAYGQSGAGKSFTMGTSGPLEQGNKQLMGVIPRAATVLFGKLNPQPNLNRNGSGLRSPNRYSMSALSTLNGAKSPTTTERNWQLKATYVEIYNEQLRDLLVPETVPAHERGTVAIREDAKGRILLTGLHQVSINSMEDLMSALNFGSMIRQTDSTAINAKSSRSHAVFSLNLIQRKSKPQDISIKDKRLSMPVDSVGGVESWFTIDSKLHFVDLAGSERLKNTGASGERAKEGISINAGLASLGKVISQLSVRQAGTHVSYRDSKLTRLLQDSLGGNAITYMIACVTPAEFHLSETLNTVQYAQRARAIQSKPKIQQVSDDSDKQAMIERLRAEVSFLRDQIRNSERDRTGSAPQDRIERQNEREMDLQNHLLDVQENYSALSQRHARLISEIAKARDDSSKDPGLLVGTVGESPAERLKRSTSFADAVEQVVLEYEKTIQSLETSLSNTRSSLASTESSLLERETKCAYAETHNQQLQSRIQKLIDRESSAEHYVHDLEARLDGRVVGEEKNTAVMVELRKELARLRENETTTEEYISTLEERLAEADQDSELMHREISRLEHVVERQRSVGKLDNLLYELDHVQSKETKDDKDRSLTNGVSKSLYAKKGHDSKISHATLKVATETPIPESDDEGEGEHPPVVGPESYVQSPAQSRFVQEKLSTVNQELFDLRVEHESTVNEFDLLSAKYEEALRTLATLQESMDGSRQPPASPPTFLADARVNELKNAGQSSSSRSLSSELSSVGESPAVAEPEGLSKGQHEIAAAPSSSNEIKDLTASHAEKDEGLIILQAKYDDLREQHSDALDLVEELKAEVQKAKLSTPPSPTLLIRRKSSQIMTIDRAHRSLASLGNIAAENFTDKPEIKDSFELNLNAVMHELHQRSERVQVLESEIAAVKKEMETKMTIISGLTRERSSLKTSSPVDMSMLSSMRDQILQSEHQLKMLHESSASREAELVKEIGTLKETLSAQTEPNHFTMPGTLPITPAIEQTSERRELDLKVSQLETQIGEWENKHQSALDSMRTSEKKMIETITELEQTLASVDSIRQAKTSELDSLANSMSAAAAAFDLERQKHTDTVTSLHQELEQHKSIVAGYATQVSDLQRSQSTARQEIEAAKDFKQKTQMHLDEHRDQISALEKQLTEHQAAVEFHKYGLKSLHDSHAAELEEARSSSLKQFAEESEARIADLSSAHQEESDKLEERIRDLESKLHEHQTIIEEHKRQVEERGVQINNLEKEKQSHSRSASDATDDLREAKAKLKLTEEAQTAALASLTEAQARAEELSLAKSELDKELVELREKEQRASRLVEELEGQLNSTFEDSRNATSRLSLMQNTRDQELAEARAASTKAQEETAMLRHRIEQIESRGRMSPNGINPTDMNGERTNSLTRRINTPVTTLPSPPPAIPLPALPNAAPNSGSPPSSSHLRGPSSPHRLEEQEQRIRTIEKHLFAEKQLTATLEEALTDLETQANRFKSEMETWKKKAWNHQDELNMLRKERNANRHSLQAVEEERSARREAEAAKAHLEEKMAMLNRKKKKNPLNCF